MKNRKIIILFTLLLSMGLFSQATSQEPADKIVLNLQGAVDHALTYNKSLKNARLEVERSRARNWEAISQGLPQVDGGMDYQSFFNYELEFSFGMGGGADFTQDQLLQAFNETQAAFPFYSPQDLAVHGANSYCDGVLQGMLPPNTILMSDQASAKLMVNQLIFSGQYIVGIQTAKLAMLISEQNLDFNELNIKESVIGSYYLVLITEESLEIVKQNHDNLQETLEQTEIMFRTGMAEQTDVDQIRITVNQLANATTSLQRNLELNYNLLRFQLGLETNVDIELSDDLESLFTNMQAETGLDATFDVEDNLTYKIMKTQEEINKKMLGLEQWNYAPTITGFYNYNAKILTTDFDMNPNHMVGLNMAVPIFSSGMRKARVDQAKIDYNMAQVNRDIMEDQLLLQEKQYKYNLQSSLDNFFLQQENVEVAQRVFDSYQRKFEQGMATSLDLTNANSNYLDAENNYMTAIMEVMNAKLQLDKLMNTL